MSIDEYQSNSDLTRAIADIGVKERAMGKVISLAYKDFRAMAERYMQKESSGHTLQPTALVNEAFMKLASRKRTNYKGKRHFFSTSARIMKNILIDHARSKQRDKRGGGQFHLCLSDIDTVGKENSCTLFKDRLQDALKSLEKIDRMQAKIVEMRYFYGYNMDEIALFFQVSKRTIESEWAMIRAWLQRELDESADTIRLNSPESISDIKQSPNKQTQRKISSPQGL